MMWNGSAPIILLPFPHEGLLTESAHQFQLNSTQHFCTKKLQEAGIASYSKRLTRPPIAGPRLPAAHGNGRLALAESYMTSQLPTETSIQQLQDLNTDNKGSHRYSLFLFTFRLFSNSFYLVLLTLKGTLELLLRKKGKICQFEILLWDLH